MKKLVPLALVAVLAVFAPLALAGRVPTPGIDTSICEAHGTVTYRDTFYGGETARVTLVGDGDTDLDIYVYDLSGRLVASGIGLSDREVVSWYVPSTATYRIEVRNLGGVWNRFTLTTN